MTGVTLTLHVPDALVALLERLVLAAEALAENATHPRMVIGGPKPADDLAQWQSLGAGARVAEAVSDPRVAEGVHTQCQPSDRRDVEEGGAKPVRDTASRPEAVATSAAGGSPAPSARVRVWTREREDLVRRDYAAGVPVDVMCAAINALPGPRIPMKRIAVYAAKIGVRRPAKPPIVPPPAPIAAAVAGKAQTAVAPSPVPVAQDPKPVASNTPAPVAQAAKATPARQAGTMAEAFARAIPVRPSPPLPALQTKAAPAAPTPPGPAKPAVAGAPLPMSYAAIVAFAQPHGLYSATHGFKLDEVNAKRDELGLRRVFILKRRVA